jgi:hypothetical protein
LNLTKLKYILIIIPLLAGSAKSYGQLRNFNNLAHFDDRKIHFGFYLGLNTMDYRITNYNNVYENPVFSGNQPLKDLAAGMYGDNTSYGSEVYTIMPGFTVGGVINARLNRDFDLRFTPGMSLGNRKFQYYIDIDPGLVTESGQDLKNYLSTPSYYIDLPVGVRYKGFRHFNLRPYIYLGGAYRHDLANKKISQSVVHIKRAGGYAEVAMGLDSYLEYFRFTAEFRFSYGLNNLIRHDTDPVNTPFYGYLFKELDSNIFTLIFYFE